MCAGCPYPGCWDMHNYWLYTLVCVPAGTWSLTAETILWTYTWFFFSSLILIVCADEHLTADDYPSDQCCSWTSVLSPCLNVSLVNARLHYYTLGGGVCLWPWALPVSLSSWHHSSKLVIFSLVVFFSAVKMHMAHAVNKEGKVSHCWVIADVSNPYWETFNFQLCLAFLVSNHYCDKWSFQSKEAVGIFSAHLTTHFWLVADILSFTSVSLKRILGWVEHFSCPESFSAMIISLEASISK